MPIERRRILMLLATAATLATHAVGAADEDADREKVQGIGGFFFRAKDPKALAAWYRDHLGIALTPTGDGSPGWQTQAGITSFTPFPMNTDYFGEGKMWMMNFRVGRLDKIAAQLQAKGIEVKVDPKTYPYGRFAHLKDPEGNSIELWQPA